MSAFLLCALFLSQAPVTEAEPPAGGVVPAVEPAAQDDASAAVGEAAPPGEVAPPAEEPATAPADAVAPDAWLPRSSDKPLDAASLEQKIGRIVSGVVLGVGAALVAAGVLGLGSAAVLQLSPWPAEPKPDENPRRTLITIASAIAAGGLMLGLTCVLGGAFGVFIG